MNRQEFLIAYLEGTLSPVERRHVYGKINQSARWRNELERLQTVRRELQNEMPLMGHVSGDQLAAMLPGILDEARPLQSCAMQARRLKRFMMTSAGLIILLVATLGFARLTASAQAAIGSLGNVPRVTNTPPVSAESTLESNTDLFMVHLLSDQQFEAFPVASKREDRLAASPVPMPETVMTTAEPSAAALSRP